LHYEYKVVAFGLILLNSKKQTGFTVLYLNVAKVEDVSDPRRQGWSRSHLLRTLENKGDGVSSAFPWGKQHGEKRYLFGYHWQSNSVYWQ